MRSCEDYEVLISAFLDGELEGEARRELEEHLTVCPACRAYLTDQRRIGEALHSLDAAAPEGFAAGVMARVRAGKMPERRQRARPRWRRWAAGAAACCALAALDLWWSQREAPADGVALTRGMGPDAALYRAEGLDPCALENGPVLPLPDDAPAAYAGVLTTDSEIAGAWVAEHLGTAWESGGTYPLTAEEYAALRETLLEAGADFTEEAGTPDADAWLLAAQ